MRDILIVEDNLSLWLMLDDTLTRMGYKVQHTTNCAQTRAYLEDEHNAIPDAILFDMTLPDGDGLMVLEAMQPSRFATTRTIAMSDQNFYDLSSKSRKIDYFVYKPVAPVTLREAFDRLFLR